MDVKCDSERAIPSELRVPPRQKRARQTVRHILDTAAVLLDEVGVDDFNTNLLAERGLTHPAPFRRLDELTRLGDRDDVFELAKRWRH